MTTLESIGKGLLRVLFFRGRHRGVLTEGLDPTHGLHLVLTSFHAPGGRRTKISLRSSDGKVGDLSVRSGRGQPADTEFEITLEGGDLAEAVSALDFRRYSCHRVPILDGWQLSAFGFIHGEHFERDFNFFRWIGWGRH